mgnify:FL=1
MSLPTGTIVDGTWRVEKLVGQGTFCEVYSATHSFSADRVALKVERNTIEPGAGKLDLESDVLAAMAGHAQGFAKRLNSGSEISCRCPSAMRSSKRAMLIMSLLGRSLSAVRKRAAGGRLAPATATRVALSLLECVQKLHAAGWIHRDIKASNFVLRDDTVDIDSARTELCVIDFGLA